VSKRLASTALVVGLAIIAVGCGGGGSSAVSSEWSASDAAKVEAKLADTLTERGFTPTKAGTECIREGLEPVASASEILGNAQASSKQNEEIEEILTDCIGESGSGSTETASGGEPESLYAGPACEEELSSSGCIQEVEEKESTDLREGEETYGAGAEESGEENQGLQEMNEELQQEYEEEGVAP
jgi:hypothetical protein